MARWWESSEIYAVRLQVAGRLKLPDTNKDEYLSPARFWADAEKVGRLVEALALYDQVAAGRAAWRHLRRETKGDFERRIEREGRQAEAERVRAELLASGLSHRDAQEELVHRLQPLDGSQTRAWPTPDPWEAGRLFLKKADQERLLADAREEDEDEDDGFIDDAAGSARWRVECAERRRAERLALAAARRRAQALKAAASA
jgi:hypothetical protein